jgi:hypothetical protein
MLAYEICMIVHKDPQPKKYAMLKKDIWKWIYIKLQEKSVEYYPHLHWHGAETMDSKLI